MVLAPLRIVNYIQPATALGTGSTPVITGLNFVRSAKVNLTAVGVTAARGFCHPDEGGSIISVEKSITESAWSQYPFTSWSLTPIGSRNGRTPNFGTEKTTAQIDGETIISLRRDTAAHTGPNLKITGCQVSTDGWQTISDRVVEVSIPNNIPNKGDTGTTNPGHLVSQHAFDLEDGSWIVMAYGLETGDDRPWAGYPIVSDRFQYRMTALQTTDGFLNLVKQADVGVDTYEGRGTNPDSSSFDTALCTMLAQEGLVEATGGRFPDGSRVVIMRSGSRKSGALSGTAPTATTPLYTARSTAASAGLVWQAPRQLVTNPTGECVGGGEPRFLVLDNGVGVLASSSVMNEEGAVLQFCLDYDLVFSAPWKISNSDSDMFLFDVGRDEFGIIYSDASGSGTPKTFELWKVERTVDLAVSTATIKATPMTVLAGASTRLFYRGQRISNLTLTGGPFTATSVTNRGSISSGPLDDTTVFTLDYDEDGGGTGSAQVTVTVV